MVRTPRGRSAALRGVWGALIRTPARIFIVVGVIVVVLVGVGFLLDDNSPVSRVSTSSESTASPDRIAWAFTVAWVTHPTGTTSDEWVGRLRPYTDASFLPALKSVNPDNVPSQSLTGSPRVVSVGDQEATVDVPTDEVVLRVQLKHTSNGWRVVSYSEAE